MAYDVCICGHARYEHVNSGCYHPENDDGTLSYCAYCPGFTAI